MTDFLTVLALAYLAVLAFMYFSQRNMLYFPEKTRPDPAAYGAQGLVEIVKVTTADGLALEGWYFPPANPGGLVIVNFHGNAARMADRLPKMAEFINKGYGVLLAEYRGYGGNPGTPSENGLYEDGQAYIRWLRERGIGPAQTVLYGESLGTGIAVQLATDHSEGAYAAVILESPYSTLAEVAQSIYFYMPVKFLMKDQFRSIDKIAAIKAPLLIMHGGKDSTIPLRFARRLFQAAVQPKSFEVLDAAGHNDLYDHGAAALVLDFLKTPGFSVPDVKTIEEIPDNALPCGDD